MKNRYKPFFYDKKRTPAGKIILIVLISAGILIFIGFQIPGIRQVISEPIYAAASFTWNGLKKFITMTRMYSEPEKPRQTYTPLEMPDREVLFAEDLESLSMITQEDPLADLRQTPTPSEFGNAAKWEFLDPNLNYDIRSGDTTQHDITQIQLIPPVFEHADLFNDGAAILSAVMRYWGIVENQYQIAAYLHHDPLDPFISFSDMESYVSNFYPDFSVLVRLNGDSEILTALLQKNIPVIVFVQTNTSLSFWPGDDRISGHYFLILGYDSQKGMFSYQDTYRGNTMEITAEELLSVWYPYQRSYMVIYPTETENDVKDALSENFYNELNIQRALTKFKTDAEMLPGNPYAQFNLGVMLHKDGDENGAWDRFVSAMDLSLPQRFLNYRSDILETALMLGYADDITKITDEQFDRNAHDEILTVYRGWASILKGKLNEGTELFTKAKQINPNSDFVLYALKYRETMLN